ncbi:hypothetical protein P7C70_g8230, partial [Phenoliferia sp. Uapishka_3]
MAPSGLADLLKERFEETPAVDCEGAVQNFKKTCQNCFKSLDPKDAKHCSACLDCNYCSRSSQNRIEEKALSDPATHALGVALKAWIQYIRMDLDNAVTCALRLGFSDPIHKTHTFVVTLAHRPNDRDPSTCFIVTDATATSHAQLDHYFRTYAPGAFPKGTDVREIISQDGINNFYGLKHAPKEHFRCLIAFIAYGSSKQLVKRIFYPVSLSPVSELEPHFQPACLEEVGWLETFRAQAAFSEIKKVQGFLEDREITERDKERQRRVLVAMGVPPENIAGL